MGKKCTFLACLLVLGSVSSSSGLRFKLPTDVTVLPISVVQVAEANHAPSEMSEEGGESGDTGTSHDEDPKSASEKLFRIWTHQLSSTASIYIYIYVYI